MCYRGTIDDTLPNGLLYEDLGSSTATITLPNGLTKPWPSVTTEEWESLSNPVPRSFDVMEAMGIIAELKYVNEGSTPR